MGWLARVGVVVVVAAACGARGESVERDEFHGITYEVPKGTNRANSGVDRPSHYPDPKTGEVIELPTRIEPAISLMMPDTHRYFVSIKKPPERVTLEGMKASMSAQPGASDVQGHAEKDGWTVTYAWRHDDGTSTQLVVRRFAFADSDYVCEYDTGSSKDLAAAQRICASVKPVRR